MTRVRSWLGVLGAAATLAVVSFTPATAFATSSNQLPTYGVWTLQEITRLYYPSSATLSPDGLTLYVAERDTNSIFNWVISSPAAYGQMTPVCSDGGSNATMSPDGKTMYVACWGGGIEAVDLSDNLITPIIGSTFARPDQIAVSPDGKLLYISGGNSTNTSGGVEVADVSGVSTDPHDDSVVGSIAGVTAPASGISLSPDGKLLYIPSWASGTIQIANVAAVSAASANAGKLTDSTITDPNATSVSQVAVAPDNTTLYISDYSKSTGAGTTVSIADISGGASNDTVVGTVASSFDAPWGIAISASGNNMYVVNNQYGEGLPNISVVSVPNATVTTPAVSGSDQVGGTLTATATSPQGAVAYRWYANGAPISAATSPTLALTAADLNKQISVVAIADAAGWAASESDASTAGKAVAGALQTAVPRITGKAVVGATLSASVNAWSPHGVKLAYQWYASGRKLAGATGRAVKLATKLKGKSISVKVTGSLAGYTTATVASRPTGKVISKSR